MAGGHLHHAVFGFIVFVIALVAGWAPIRAPRAVAFFQGGSLGVVLDEISLLAWADPNAYWAPKGWLNLWFALGVEALILAALGWRVATVRRRARLLPAVGTGVNDERTDRPRSAPSKGRTNMAHRDAHPTDGQPPDENGASPGPEAQTNGIPAVEAPGDQVDGPEREAATADESGEVPTGMSSRGWLVVAVLSAALLGFLLLTLV